jgi:AcrR family transcriptional regulator
MEYDERKNEILNAAQKYFYTVGYEKTSVNMIIEELGIAKGTFYHYFNSKVELLDELVDRMALDIMEAINPIAENEMNAVEKLNLIFTTARTIKTDNIDLMIPAMKVLYSDENIITRYKMNMKNAERMLPLYIKIITQGLNEGCFDTKYPDETALVIINLWLGLGESIIKDLLNNPNIEEIKKDIDAYVEAVERILGMKKGKFKIIDIEILKIYVDSIIKTKEETDD